MMSMTDLVDKGVETLNIDSGCPLEKEFTELIHMNSLMVIIPNCQSSWFMTHLCMWCFDLRHQIHLMDGWSYFDYDLQIRSHGISKTSYIRCDMKSTKMIVWSRGNHLPQYLKRLTQGMRCNEIIGKGSRNIGEKVFDDFVLASVLT